MDFYFIGEPELVTAFRFIGIDGTAAPNAEAARAAFLRITAGYDATTGTALPSLRGGGGACAALILTEEVVDWLGGELTQWQLSGKYPLIVEMPGTLGRHPGRKTLVDSIREAVGVRV
jgi:V/A-type H+-transporting ATPase subunit F